MNRINCNVVLFIFVFLSMLSVAPAHAEQFKATGTVDTYFSPHGGAAEAIVKEINNAKTEILVQAYSFTSRPIAKALADARKRSIKIEVILDRSQRSQRYSPADFLAHADVQTYIDSTHAIAHNKIIIIDRSTLITGSFNFTRAAEENNAENLMIMKGNKPLVYRYIENFNEHRGHAEKYVAR